MTAPQLFASYWPEGPHRCYYCGGRCDETHRAADLVQSSFTARDTVAGGEYVCPGCIAAMDERATITLADGEVREGQRVRCYSWVITAEAAIAATKAHRAWLTGACLSPPEPPYVISISDSGQRHLLYRAVVCHSREIITATLEGERVTFTPYELDERLTLCRKLIAATGKPALSEAPTARFGMSVVSHHDDESLISTWLECREQPLSRLAAWLSPPKEECLLEFPAPAAPAPTACARHRAVQATFSWLD